MKGAGRDEPWQSMGTWDSFHDVERVVSFANAMRGAVLRGAAPECDAASVFKLS